MVVFDKHGCGQDDRNTQQLENEVRTRLSINGWPDNAEVIIIEPELENWVWSKSSELPQILGWKQNLPLFDYLEQNYEIRSGKPLHPKETLQEILKKNGKPFSSSIHKAVAENVSLERCEDEAFVRLKHTLQGWFVEAG